MSPLRTPWLDLTTTANRASEIAEDKKHKNVEPEDIIKALTNNGFENYVDAFKKGLEESKPCAGSKPISR